MITQENIPYTADEIKAMVKTIEELRKKYKEALERMKSWAKGEHPECFSEAQKTAEFIFPELKESKDERIRKELIEQIAYIIPNNDEVDDEGNALPSYQERINKYRAWLEKQGEQKSVDKAEPKFKVGDFIINDYCLGKVIVITNDAYLLDTGQGIPFSCENTHLWTINDAKDGDVFMTTKIRNCPFIYRKTDYNNNLAYYYAGVDGNGDFCEGCLKRTMYHFGSVADITPATKEQRDLLFKKMKEAGYEWDADKKELKKIEVASKESKDERIRKTIYGWIYTQPSEFFDNGFSKEEMLDWVEKQGEKNINHIDIKEKAHQIAWEASKNYDPSLSKESWCEMAALDMASWLEKQGEQKSADEVEPKFKAGNKVIFTNGNVEKIVSVGTHGYTFEDGDWLTHEFVEKDARLYKD